MGLSQIGGFGDHPGLALNAADHAVGLMVERRGDAAKRFTLFAHHLGQVLGGANGFVGRFQQAAGFFGQAFAQGGQFDPRPAGGICGPIDL